MKTIWALFDDATRSVYNAFKDNPKYQVRSIGINDLKEPNYYKIDLGLTNENLIEELKKLPKPDIILASPPCESWSLADCSGRLILDINEQGIVQQNKIYYDSYNETSHPCKRRDFFKKMSKKINGENTVLGLVKVLDFFKPKHWVIENPRSSLIWKYLKLILGYDYFENDTYYNAYDESFTVKPTKFLSNKNLNLLNTYKPNYKIIASLGYNKSSSIPSKLLQTIVSNLEDNKN